LFVPAYAPIWSALKGYQCLLLSWMFPPLLVANVLLVFAWTDMVLSSKPQIGLSGAALGLACTLSLLGTDAKLYLGGFLWFFSFVFAFVGAITSVAEYKRMHPFESLSSETETWVCQIQKESVDDETPI
jgi:hypothetical protein